LVNFANTLTADLKSLQGSIDGILDTVSSVPFIGNQLGQVKEAKVFVDNLVTGLTNTFNQITDDKTLQTTIQTKLFGLLGPKSGGLDLLAPHNGMGLNKNAMASDIIVTVQTDDSFEVDMRLHKDLVQSTLPFKIGLGLPGIPFSVKSSGAVNVMVGFDYELDFKYTASNSAFTVGPATLQGTGPGAGHQMSLNVTASLAPNPTPFTATVDVGFIEGTLTDHLDSTGKGQTSMNLDFNVDHLDPNNLGGITANVSGSAKLDLDLTGGFTGDTKHQYPQISAEMVLNWGFDTAKPSDPVNLPTLAFNNVSVDFGSFLDNLLHPILQDIQKVTGPLEPIVKELKAPIPGLSDLSHAIGGGDVTLLSLVQDASKLEPGSDFANYVGIVSQLVDIVNIVNNAAQFGNTQVPINLGSFDLANAGDLRNLPQAGNPLSGLGDLTTGLSANPIGAAAGAVIQQLNAFASKTPALQGAVMSAENALNMLMGTGTGSGQNGISFAFPIFQDPVHSAFKLLLGQDADFVTFSAHYHLTMNEQESFSCFGLVVTFGGTLDFDAGLKLAYDTYGIREFIQPGPHQFDPADFLDGLYIDESPDPSNNNLPFTHLSLSGNISAGVGAGIPGASITLNGGVWVPQSNPILLTLHDPNNDGLGVDNKLRAREILDDVSHLGCAFDTKGELDAGLFAEIKVGFDNPLGGGFIGYDQKFPIATAQLLNFTSGGCNSTPSNPPVLAGIDPTVPGRLDLYTGIFASKRKNISDMSMGNETFEVSDMGGTPGDETVGVTAFGYTQTIDHVSSIYANGTGDTSDKFTVDAGVTSNATLIGGGTIGDTLSYLGTGSATLTGSAGPDLLTIGANSQASTVKGNGGNDVLIGGGGADTLSGGGGPGDTDTFFAGPGNNQVLNGGQGTNYFNAGTGSSQMNGGAGTNDYFWQTGAKGPMGQLIRDGAVTVHGKGSNNTLSVAADEAGDSLVAGRGSITVSSQSPSTVLGTIQFTGTQTLNMDDSGGHGAYTVNDLAGTGIQNVYVNLHEVGTPDGTANSVIENVVTSPTANVGAGPATVTVDTTQSPTVKGVKDSQQNNQHELLGQVTTTNVAQTYGDTGNVSYTITAAIPDPKDQVTLNTHGGPDTITVKATQSGGGSTDPNQIPQQPGGQVTVNTYAGTDTLFVGVHTLDNFFGPLYLYAQTGAVDQLTFDESWSYVNDFVRLSATQLVRYNQPPSVFVPPNSAHNNTDKGYTETAHPFVFTFQTMGGSFKPGVTLDTAYGGTNLYIPETGVNEPVTVNADGGLAPDQIYVGFDGANVQGATTVEGIAVASPFPATAALSTLDHLVSTLLINAPSGGPTLNVDDEATAVAETYTLTTTTLARTGAATITYNVASTPGALIAVNGSQGGSIYDIQSIATGAENAITGGKGNDTFNICPLSKNYSLLSAGHITVSGGGGTDTMSVYDQNSPVGHQYGFENQFMVVVGIRGTAFHGLSSINLYCSNGVGRNVISYLPDSSALPALNIDGGTNAAVNVIEANFPYAPSWDITKPNGGTNGQSISFSNFGLLEGGSYFRFEPLGTVVYLSGGRSFCWLDYSAFTTPVTVNLATGSATNVNGGAAGAVTDIQNVHGGSGGNTLTGTAQGNILIGGSGADTITGGTGRSLLIGDGGADHITGGSTSGGDILIGGTTSYDSDTRANLIALMAILTEWQSTDSYSTRFTSIDNGTIPGGYELRFGTTVLDDGATNTLKGAAGTLALDWFFAGASDTKINYVSGEHLNNT